MKSTTDFITLVLYNDWDVLEPYNLSKQAKFVSERRKVLAEVDWNAKTRTLHRLSKITLRELLGVRFLSRRKVGSEFNTSEWVALHYIMMSEVLQSVCELELYGLYKMKEKGEEIPQNIITEITPYIRYAAENVKADNWREKFLKLLDSLNL